MEQNVSLWNANCKKAFYGFLAFTLGAIVVGILNWISLGSTISGFANGEMGGVGFTDVLSIIVNILIILGYVYYLIGIKGMQTNAPNEIDGLSVKPVFIGALLCVIGEGIDFIPFIPGFIIRILSLLGFIFMMIGFNKMKQSKTLSEMAVKGSAKLFIAMLLAVIGCGLGFIPLAGGIIESLINIVVLVFGILGWKQLANS